MAAYKYIGATTGFPFLVYPHMARARGYHPLITGHYRTYIYINLRLGRRGCAEKHNE